MSDALFDVPNVAAERSLATYFVKRNVISEHLRFTNALRAAFMEHISGSSTPTLASQDFVKIEPVARPFQRKGCSPKAPPILSSNAYLRGTCQGQPFFWGIPKMSTQKAVAECLSQC